MSTKSYREYLNACWVYGPGFEWKWSFCWNSCKIAVELFYSPFPQRIGNRRDIKPNQEEVHALCVHTARKISPSPPPLPKEIQQHSGATAPQTGHLHTYMLHPTIRREIFSVVTLAFKLQEFLVNTEGRKSPGTVPLIWPPQWLCLYCGAGPLNNITRFDFDYDITCKPQAPPRNVLGLIYYKYLLWNGNLVKPHKSFLKWRHAPRAP